MRKKTLVVFLFLSIIMFIINLNSVIAVLPTPFSPMECLYSGNTIMQPEDDCAYCYVNCDFENAPDTIRVRLERKLLNYYGVSETITLTKSQTNPSTYTGDLPIGFLKDVDGHYTLDRVNAGKVKLGMKEVGPYEYPRYYSNSGTMNINYLEIYEGEGHTINPVGEIYLEDLGKGSTCMWNGCYFESGVEYETDATNFRMMTGDDYKRYKIELLDPYCINKERVEKEKIISDKRCFLGCPDKRPLDLTFQSNIDIKEKDDPDYDDIALDPYPPGKDIDMSILFNLYTAEADFYKDKEELSYQEKLKCGLPNSFNIELYLSAYYYEHWLAGTINNMVSKNREAINLIKDILIPLIEDADYNPDDYFISDDEIFIDMIGHWILIDDSVRITEYISFNIRLVDDNKIVLDLNTNAYSKDWKDENAYKRQYNSNPPELKEVISKIYTPEIILAEGPAALELYQALYWKMIDLTKTVTARDTFRIRTEEEVEGKNKNITLYLYPDLLQDQFNDFDDNRDCCGIDDSTVVIPDVPIDSCPSEILQFGGHAGATLDVQPIDNTDFTFCWSPINIVHANNYCRRIGDVKVRASLKFNDINYDKDNEDFWYSTTQCGVPQKMNLSLIWSGLYYDYAGKNINLFEKTRRSLIPLFPESIKDLFKRAGYDNILIDTDEVVKAIDENSVSSIDDSQQVSESLELIFENIDGVLYLEIKDTIIRKPFGDGLIVNSWTPIHIRVPILNAGTLTSGAIAGIVEESIGGFISMEDVAMLTQTIPEYDDDGLHIANTVPVPGETEFNFYELLRMNSLKTKCCYQPEEEQSTEQQGRGRLASGEGNSIYYLRDINNPSPHGKAYLVKADKEIKLDITKWFQSPDDENLKVFKIKDKHIPFYSFDVLGETNYSFGNMFSPRPRLGTPVSHDSLFMLYFYLPVDFDPMLIHESLSFNNITIQTINITSVAGENFSFDQIQVGPGEVIPYEKVELIDAMIAAKAYTKYMLHDYEAEFRILEWAYSPSPD